MRKRCIGLDQGFGVHGVPLRLRYCHTNMLDTDRTVEDATQKSHNTNASSLHADISKAETMPRYFYSELRAGLCA